MPARLKDLMCGDPRLTLSVAESITCGRLQSRIGSVSGASEFFVGGITAYSIEQKVRHLGVDRTHATAVNAISATVAEQMAIGACRMFGTVVGLATTGYAERSPEHGAAAPYAFWALAYCPANRSAQVVSGRVDCEGMERVAVQQRVAEVVVDELVRFLTQLRSSPQS